MALRQVPLREVDAKLAEILWSICQLEGMRGWWLRIPNYVEFVHAELKQLGYEVVAPREYRSKTLEVASVLKIKQRLGFLIPTPSMDHDGVVVSKNTYVRELGVKSTNGTWIQSPRPAEPEGSPEFSTWQDWRAQPINPNANLHYPTCEITQPITLPAEQLWTPNAPMLEECKRFFHERFVSFMASREGDSSASVADGTTSSASSLVAPATRAIVRGGPRERETIVESEDEWHEAELENNERDEVERLGVGEVRQVEDGSGGTTEGRGDRLADAARVWRETTDRVAHGFSDSDDEEIEGSRPSANGTAEVRDESIESEESDVPETGSASGRTKVANRARVLSEGDDDEDQNTSSSSISESECEGDDSEMDHTTHFMMNAGIFKKQLLGEERKCSSCGSLLAISLKPRGFAAAWHYYCDNEDCDRQDRKPSPVVSSPPFWAKMPGQDDSVHQSQQSRAGSTRREINVLLPRAGAVVGVTNTHLQDLFNMAHATSPTVSTMQTTASSTVLPAVVTLHELEMAKNRQDLAERIEAQIKDIGPDKARDKLFVDLKEPVQLRSGEWVTRAYKIEIRVDGMGFTRYVCIVPLLCMYVCMYVCM
jgi:hypothetical protein